MGLKKMETDDYIENENLEFFGGRQVEKLIQEGEKE